MRNRLYVEVRGEYCGAQKIAAPWGDDQDFLRYKELARDSLVTTDRLWILYCLAKQARTIEGTWFECGVYKGGTIRMLAALAGRAVIGIDTFEGLPEPNPEKDRHPKGVFSDVSRHAVLDSMPSNVRFWVKDIRGADLVGHQAAFVHVDVDLHACVKAACEQFYPIVVPRGIMVFDDYGGYEEPGAADAVDEFFADKPEFPLILPTGQAVVIKL